MKRVYVQEESTQISFFDICRALEINPAKPRYNPKDTDYLNHLENLKKLTGNEEKANEIMGLAVIGEINMLRMLYP